MTDNFRIFPSRSLLPAEIVSLIIKCLDSTLYSYGGRDHLQQLSSISLVCWHWCNTLRPKLWQLLHLRSRAELQELLEIVSRPGCMVGRWTQNVTLETKEDEIPWIPAAMPLFPLLAARLPHLKILQYLGSSSDGARQSHAQPVPSAAPAFMCGFRALRVLYLNGFRGAFGSPQQLIHFISPLPLLEVLFCEYIQWKTLPLVWHPPRRSKINARLEKVIVFEPASTYHAWTLLWLFSTSSRIVQSDLRFPQIADEVIVALMALFAHSYPDTVSRNRRMETLEFKRTDGNAFQVRRRIASWLISHLFRAYTYHRTR